MVRNCYGLFVVLALLFFSSALSATPAIVDGKWLLNHLDDKNMMILDIQPREYYQQYHVPGAINAPFSLWKTGNKSKPPGMMLPVKKLTTMLGKLGINENNQVVIVATGTGVGDMAAIARVFWTFKVLGHQDIAILDGGLASYANEHKGPLSKQPETRQSTIYKPKLNHQIVADSDMVLNAIKSKKILLDARSRGEYVGVIQGGKHERAGTLPGAKNLPYDWMTINQSAKLRPKKEIQKLFNSIEADKKDDTIHFCHTGSRAALTWFVDYAILGHKKAKLYDASMIEWAVDKAKPIEVKLPLTD